MHVKKRITNLNDNKNKGFTLIEVIVVIVIMGILVGLTAPQVSGYIERIQLKNYVRTARLAEDTVMSLSGMQYSKAGNPIVGNPDADFTNVSTQATWTWADNYYLDESVHGRQYVYLDAWRYNKSSAGGEVQNLIRMAPANLGADPDQDQRKSAGLTEYRSRTGEDIPIEDWVAHNGNVNACETRISQSVFIKETGSNILVNPKISNYFSGIKPEKYLIYERYGSWMFRTIDDKQLVILHNFALKGNPEKGDIIETSNFEGSLELVGEQWNIYEFVGSEFSDWNSTNNSYKNFNSKYMFMGTVY